MTLHMIKLCVGVESVEELIAWQKQRLAQKKAKAQPLQLEHVTRMTPKRVDDILNGGSLYWVVKGNIACRQQILGFEPCTKNGAPHCRILLHKKTIRTQLRPFRAFQGWRYFKDEDTPLSLNFSNNNELDLELRKLGVI